MTSQLKHKREWGPDIVGIFTLISVAIGSLLTLPAGAPRWLIFLNFMLIAALMLFVEVKSLHHRLIYLSVFTLLASAFFLMGVNPGIYQILFFIISAQAMMLLPFGGALLWLLLLAIISGGAFWLQLGIESGLLTALVYSGGYLFFGIFGRSLMKAREASQRSDELLSELQQAHQQLQDNLLHSEQLAVAEERNRMAREMHDALGHRLTVSAVQLEGAQRLISDEPGRAEEMVATAREQVRKALADLRQSVATLREPLETGLEFQQALRSLLNDFESSTDLTVNLLIPEDFPLLPSRYRLTLFRTAQEALTNVQRHANAKQVWVQLNNTQSLVKLTVGDDGNGFEVEGEQIDRSEKQGFGLRGMRERAAQLNGECFFETRPGGGAQIIISLPWEGDKHDS